MDGEYTAVVDRIEVDADGDELAVLQVEADGEVVDELVVAAERLPADADEGAVLAVCLDGGDLVDATVRPQETARRRERAEDRFDRLSRRPPDDEADDGTGSDE